MTFTRTIEDFTCAQCGADVKGNGYTNHCPRCLWSRHVDISPGDRQAMCDGMMRPSVLEGASPHYCIVHECVLCGVKRRVGAAENDNTEALIALSARASA